ncbi:kazal-type serine protease inhibitor domain-containing protein 1-like [Hoplias malabaricus]|uniref:kazal-type serine protease inhibitor domain-containing protein 1-like n=1 Tax=Hoplias malabaricus TaxID=27720 RepID=UPI003461C8F9
MSLYSGFFWCACGPKERTNQCRALEIPETRKRNSPMSGVAVWCVGIWVGVFVCVWASPPHHRGWLRLWEEGESCAECDRSRCPVVSSSCPAGLVLDRCGCCEHCGNAEGQWCDLNSSQEFYGRCGTGLLCQRRATWARGQQGEPEPRCVCESQSPVCGSDGQTHRNLCQLREAASPRISRAPRDTQNYTGYDIVFACEVTAYPLPNVGWKMKDSEDFLPGDDPRISVQARGGPERYTVSTWLQIHGLRLSDAEVYFCIAHNRLGEVSASARLSVLRNVDRDIGSGLFYEISAS